MSEKPSTDTAEGDSDAILKEALAAFQRCVDEEDANRIRGKEDISFAVEEKQWPDKILKAREDEGRPALTINKLRAFIRQVVNDARQNKPQIKVSPVDSEADPETAEVFTGLIKHIETASYADIAYDTAVECAVTNGFGYIRVKSDYAFDDMFDMDLCIERVANPFSVYGDPASTSADGSDWNVAFVVEPMTKEDFKRQYGDKAQVDWDDDTAWIGLEDWRPEDRILVAEYWTRELVPTVIVLMSNGHTYSEEDLNKPDETFDGTFGELLALSGVTEVKRRTSQTYKVTQRKMTGLEVLETNEWPGRYIPIVPVYGDEFYVDGKRQLRSLIHPAIAAQRNFNYWRSSATELVALAPRVPYIGKVGSFDSDIDRWNTVNTQNHPFLEYDGEQPPQRQPLDTGAAAGSLQEALNASDDIKAIIGMYDASLGARSNETSGKAIMARQREGDVSTFHFIDNMARAIRQLGTILIDLIPHFYDAERVIRVIGEDGSERAVKINAPYPMQDDNGQPMMQPQMGPTGQPMQGPDGNPLMQPIMALHDLTVGRYDLVVSTGPSFTSRREEAANLMMEFARAFPPAAPMLMDLVARNLDWPGADTFAERLKKLVPGDQPQIPPELKQQMDEMAKENADLKQNNAADMAKVQSDFALGKQKNDNDYALGQQRLANERALKAAASDSVEAVGPDGQPTLQSPTLQAITVFGETMGQMMMQQSAVLAQVAQGLARVETLMASPTELRVGPDGVKRAVKVAAQMVN